MAESKGAHPRGNPDLGPARTQPGRGCRRARPCGKGTGHLFPTEDRIDVVEGMLGPFHTVLPNARALHPARPKAGAGEFLELLMP